MIIWEFKIYKYNPVCLLLDRCIQFTGYLFSVLYSFSLWRLYIIYWRRSRSGIVAVCSVLLLYLLYQFKALFIGSIQVTVVIFNLSAAPPIYLVGSLEVQIGIVVVCRLLSGSSLHDRKDLNVQRSNAYRIDGMRRSDLWLQVI